MDKEKLQEYAVRVSQANRSELVVIIFEAALDSIKEGRELMESGKLPEAGQELKRAKDFVEELMQSLDMQYTISHYLRQLYIYAYREICQAAALRRPERLANSAHVLEGLLSSFREVAKQDDSKPLMENTQQIYAGLTYGRGNLNETIAVGVNTHRGFEA